MKTYWYLWAEDHHGRKMLAMGPYKTREEVDAAEYPFKEWAEKNIPTWNPWCTTGGVCYTENQGEGKANKYILQGVTA